VIWFRITASHPSDHRSTSAGIFPAQDEEGFMLRASKRYSITGAAAFVAIGGAALAQDKYSLRVPDGIAFSEFRGYESWQLVSLSHSDETLNVIVANPVMIKAYQAGVSGRGNPGRTAPRW
jgi:hypothetical protein